MISRVALRYLVAKKSHKAVNVIARVSIAGVAVATAAIMVVLSVFNGFTGLAEGHLSAIDPDIRILPTKGKVIVSADSLALSLEGVDGVATAMPVLTERALLAGEGAQTPVIAMGVDPARVEDVMNLDRLIIDGVYTPVNGLPDSIAGTQLSVGVAMSTGLRPSPYAAAELFVPQRTGRINPANPAGAYRRLNLAVTGVFRVDQPEYDSEYIFVPLDTFRDLLEYSGGEASAIEVNAAQGADPAKLERLIADRLGDGFVVQGRREQQAETYRMIAVEKWVTFLMLVFILLIASFNIVSTLSLMVIEKRTDMGTLRALGATRRSVRAIFALEGWLITAAGGLAGTVLGLILALAQQHFGLIKLGADPSALSIDVYPVEVHAADAVLVLVTVFAVGGLISLISLFFTKKTV